MSPVSDRVTAGDLAKAIPDFTAPAPEEVVAFAPAPGVQRVFHVPELHRLALRLHWDVEPSADICVERPVSPPDSRMLLEAMRKTLPQASIEIVDYSRQPLPAGDIEFPAAGLHRSSNGGMWTGSVRYAGTRRFTVWARVNVSVPVTRVFAAVDLRPGGPITTAQLRSEARDEFPDASLFLASADEATGKWPRMAIRAGTPLNAGMLENPKEVVRGDTVTVDVRDGAAHLELEAVAEASGGVGETIPVLNPSTRKRFPARVDGKGRVSVSVSAFKVNP